MAAAERNRCVTTTGPRRVEAVDGAVPVPGPSDVLIRTLYSGISAGTELNVYRGVAPQWRRRQDERSGLFVDDGPEWTYPLVYGYANVGRVAAVGREVNAVAAGDLVFSYRPHCDWVVAEAGAVIALGDLPDLRLGVFVANVNTALNGVLDAHPAFGDVVVVTGLGIIGLVATRLLRRAGAGLIVASTRSTAPPARRGGRRRRSSSPTSASPSSCAN